MKIAKYLSALFLSAFAMHGPAHAADYTLDSVSSVEIFKTVLSPGAFTDIYSIGIGANGGIASDGGPLNLVTFSGQKLSFIDPTSFYYTLTNGVSSWTASFANDYTLTLPNVASGVYALVVNGTAMGTLPSASGHYGIAMIAAPVPEAPTYAMLLAGLGLVGFIAKTAHGG